MILLVCLGLGIILRVLSGNTIGDIGHIHVHGEAWLIAVLCLQGVLPLVRLSGTLAQAAYWLWLATFPLLIGIAWRNRSQPGMSLVALGLLLNVLVVSINGGMPVMEAAAVAAGLRGRLSMPVGDFIHVLGGRVTRLPWLADAIPLPAAPVSRVVPSAGDLLLYVGVVAFIAGARARAVSSRRKAE